MNIFSRHFVSQKFGRALGTVRMDAAGKGRVVVEFVADSVMPQEFAFSVEEFSQRAQTFSVEELVLRTAIGILHRRPGGDTSATDELRADSPPWIGDFTEVPYGGATAGYPRTAAKTYERRDGDDRLEGAVELGVQLGHDEGRPAARCYLQNERVPPSVIRRVLSNSVARRKAGNPLEGSK